MDFEQHLVNTFLNKILLILEKNLFSEVPEKDFLVVVI